MDLLLENYTSKSDLLTALINYNIWNSHADLLNKCI